MEFHHISVLLNECIDNLNIRPDGIYVDGTMGGGGHSLGIAKRLTTGRLICIDQDPNAHEAAGKRLAEYKDRITFVRDNFGNIKSILDSLEIEKIDGMLLDIGVSSHQLDEAERGFSYQQDAPLDMRMNPDRPFSAYDVVNGYDEDELDRVIFTYGEERWARRIAQFIVKEREAKPIETTGELVDIIKKAVPKGARKDGPHPAKRTFQAIRIEVNGELEVLQRAIDDVAARLAVGGRLCIITFHSLEDRIVKEAFRKQENPCICPPQFPVCVCGKKPLGRVITRKPILPSKEELEENPRSRTGPAIRTFIEPLEAISYENNILTLQIDMSQQGDCYKALTERYYFDIRVAVESIIEGEEIAQINFVYKKDDSVSSYLNEEKEQSLIDKYPYLSQGHSFETFVTSQSNAMAYAAALNVAENPTLHVYNPLFLYGNPGLGKTHLMHSIARHIIEHHPELKVLYITSEDFTNQVIEAIRSNKVSHDNSATTNLRKKFRSVDSPPPF